MAKRKRNKLQKLDYAKVQKKVCQSIKEDTYIASENLSEFNIDENILSSSNEEFSFNFSKSANNILHDIQSKGLDKTTSLFKLLKRGNHCIRDQCRQYFSDRINSIVNFVISSVDNENLLLVKLNVLRACMLFVPSVLGPYKTKLDTFLSKQLEFDFNQSQFIIQSLSSCISLLPLLGESGTNNQLYSNSWMNAMEYCTNQLDDLVQVLTGEELMDNKMVSQFKVHCRVIINLMRINLNSAVKFPIEKILSLITNAIQSDNEELRFRKTDLNIKVNLYLELVALLDCLILSLGDMLWPHSDLIFKLLVKFLRFTKESNFTPLSSTIRCRIYGTITNCLSANHSCKLFPILHEICLSALHDCQPQYLKEFPQYNLLDALPSKNKKKLYNSSKIFVAESLPTIQVPLFKTGEHDWLDFDVLAVICSSALKFLKSISTMDPMQLDIDKNEYKRNWIEFMTPIWKQTTETAVALSPIIGQKMVAYHTNVKCRRNLFELLRQLVTDVSFYDTRFVGSAYRALCRGRNADPDSEIRQISTDALLIFDILSKKEQNIFANHQSSMQHDAINTKDTCYTNYSIFASCRNTALSDSPITKIVTNNDEQIVENNLEIMVQNETKKRIVDMPRNNIMKPVDQPMDTLKVKSNVTENSHIGSGTFNASYNVDKPIGEKDNINHTNNRWNRNSNVVVDMNDDIINKSNSNIASTVTSNIGSGVIIDRSYDSIIIGNNDKSNTCDDAINNSITKNNLSYNTNNSISINKSIGSCRESIDTSQSVVRGEVVNQLNGSVSNIEYMLTSFVDSDPD